MYYILLKSTYRHIVVKRLNLSVGIFTGLLQYLQKNTAILVQSFAPPIHVERFFLNLKY